MQKRTAFLVFFWAIIILALFLRLYHVWDKPHDLYVDEAAIGWNAYSILKTGRDEHGKFLPLTFESYGDYKLPVYIYLTAFTEAIFGKTALAVRLPSVIFGTGTIAIFMLLVRLLTKSTKFALLCGLLLTISPWHLQFTRAGFEASVARFFTIFGVYLILNYFLRRKPTFFWGVASLVLSLYSYHFSRILSPLLFILLCWWHRDKLKEIIKLKSSRGLILILFLATIPFALYATSTNGLIRARSEFFTKDLPREIRGNTLKTDSWEVQQLTENYLTYFSLDFLFFSGDPIGRHSVRGMGMTYLWQLPFFLIGLYVAYKKRGEANKLFFWWMLVSPLSAAFATPNPHALRGLPGSINLTYFVAVGVLTLLPKIMKRRLYLTVFLVIVAYSLSLYLHLYYSHYPRLTSPDWAGGYKEALTYAYNHADKYQKVAISNNISRGYAYLYFYGNFDPNTILAAKDYRRGVGKFIFVDYPYPKPDNEKTLFVSLNTEPWGGTLLETVNNAGGDPAIKIWEN